MNSTRDTNGHRVPMSTSPEGVISRRAYFDRHDVVPRFIRGRRVDTLPRSGSFTDYTGPWTPQYVLSLGMVSSPSHGQASAR